MFAEFFDGRNPFDTFFVQRNGDDEDGDDTFSTFHVGGFGSVSFPRGRGPDGRKQDPPVLYDLRVSLEEIYSGCTKKMKISHKRLGPDGKTVRNEDKILTIEVKRGWKEGTKITFPKEGDQTPNNIPADVVFVLKDKPHDVFRREGSDIVYPAKISLREVRGGTSRWGESQGGRRVGTWGLGWSWWGHQGWVGGGGDVGVGLVLVGTSGGDIGSGLVLVVVGTMGAGVVLGGCWVGTSGGAIDLGQSWWGHWGWVGGGGAIGGWLVLVVVETLGLGWSQWGHWG